MLITLEFSCIASLSHFSRAIASFKAAKRINIIRFSIRTKTGNGCGMYWIDKHQLSPIGLFKENSYRSESYSIKPSLIRTSNVGSSKQAIITDIADIADIADITYILILSLVLFYKSACYIMFYTTKPSRNKKRIRGFPGLCLANQILTKQRPGPLRLNDICLGYSYKEGYCTASSSGSNTRH